MWRPWNRRRENKKATRCMETLTVTGAVGSGRASQESLRDAAQGPKSRNTETDEVRKTKTETETVLRRRQTRVTETLKATRRQTEKREEQGGSGSRSGSRSGSGRGRGSMRGRRRVRADSNIPQPSQPPAPGVHVSSLGSLPLARLHRLP